jgi:hypothetical protein
VFPRPYIARTCPFQIVSVGILSRVAAVVCQRDPESDTSDPDPERRGSSPDRAEEVRRTAPRKFAGNMYSHAVLVDVGRRDGSPRTGHDGSYGVRSLARLCSGRRAQLVAFCVLVYGCLLLLRAGHFYFDRLPHQEEPVLAVQVTGALGQTETATSGVALPSMVLQLDLR